MSELRIFVGMGDWGYLTSPMIPSLAERLRPYGKVSTHFSSSFSQAVSSHVDRHGGDDVVAVGYSLSASMLQDVCWKQTKPAWIALGVAIDPTRQWAFASKVSQLDTGMFKISRTELPKGPVWTQNAPCFRKLICFHNHGAWPFGGATFRGDNVEYWQIKSLHITAQGSSLVWDETENAVRELAE